MSLLRIGQNPGPPAVSTTEPAASSAAFEVGGTASLAVRAERLVRRFGEVTAVDEVDLDIHRGEIYGFLRGRTRRG
jgi:ABC-type glutathione transport system ATPase component